MTVKCLHLTVLNSKTLREKRNNTKKQKYPFSCRMRVSARPGRNGSLQDLTPNKRDAKPYEHNPLTPKVHQLEAKMVLLSRRTSILPVYLQRRN